MFWCGRGVIPVSEFSYIPLKMIYIYIVVWCSLPYMAPQKTGVGKQSFPFDIVIFQWVFPRWRYERSSAQCTVIHGVAYHLRYVAKQWHRGKAKNGAKQRWANRWIPQNHWLRYGLRSVGAPEWTGIWGSQILRHPLVIPFCWIHNP